MRDTIKEIVDFSKQLMILQLAMYAFTSGSFEYNDVVIGKYLYIASLIMAFISLIIGIDILSKFVNLAYNLESMESDHEKTKGDKILISHDEQKKVCNSIANHAKNQYRTALAGFFYLLRQLLLN